MNEVRQSLPEIKKELKEISSCVENRKEYGQKNKLRVKE
jgi:hypothetical protein